MDWRKNVMADLGGDDGALRELALFAGAGGGILGGVLLGWRTVCAVEIDAYAASVLVARQNDGHLPPFPIWDDVRTFDGRPWRGIVDVISGGFPCQDISTAGKGAGIDGERSGLWREFARIIGEVRPRFVLVENSPALARRGLGRVLGDLAALGYDAEWGVVSAADAILLVGDPCLCHERERIWIVGSDADSARQVQATPQPARRERARKPSRIRPESPDAASVGATATQQPRRGNGAERVREAGDADGNGRRQMEREDKGAEKEKRVKRPALQRGSGGRKANWWATEPDVGRVANGVAARVDRIRAIGNGQVPAVAALAWRILRERLAENRPCHDATHGVKLAT